MAKERSILFLQFPNKPPGEFDSDKATTDFQRQLENSAIPFSPPEPAYDYRHLLSPETRERLEDRK